MRRIELLFVIVLVIAASVLGLKAVWGQDANPDPSLEKFDELISKTEALTAETKALRDEVAGRLSPPEPEPPAFETPFPVWRVDPATGEKTLITAPETPVEGPFTLCAEGSPPVTFAYDGRAQTENQPLFCAAGGNDAPLPSMDLAPGVHDVTISAQGVPAFTIALAVLPTTSDGGSGEPGSGAGTTPPSDAEPGPLPGSFDIQIGPWTLAPYNLEEPLIDIFKSDDVSWARDDMTTKEFYAVGAIDPKTGYLKTLPKGWARSGVYFSAPQSEPDNSHWYGNWVLTWDTSCGPDGADLGLFWFPKADQMKTAPGRVEFTRKPEHIYHAAVSVSRLDCPLTNISIFRKENEALLKAGKIFNPKFVDEIKRYGIVRTMDFQEANRAGITKVSDLAVMKSCCWANYAYKAGEFHPFRSAPLEAVARLAVEADVSLWHHAPAMLGAPKTYADLDGNIASIRAMAGGNAETILESDEWDKYADALVAALEKTGYPEDRVFYTTVSNEVWNFANRYYLSTSYLDYLGRGLYGGTYMFREGYGAALARWKIALDGALKRANRTQKVFYIVEGQAANPSFTGRALKAMKARLEKSGRGWAAEKSAVGVSVASYWSVGDWTNVMSEAEWTSRIENDPQGAMNDLQTYLLSGPASVVSTKAWVLAQFAANEKQANDYGVKIIGAYEGGPHLEKPKFIPKDWYEKFLWGPHGARVNEAVNDALIEAYPGVILSNYAGIGPKGGQPWFDGLYADDNPLKLSWEKYLRTEE